MVAQKTPRDPETCRCQQCSCLLQCCEIPVWSTKAKHCSSKICRWSSTIQEQKTDTQALARHFDSLLNKINPSDSSVLDALPDLLPSPYFDELPKFTEVLLAVRSLKNNKSPGPDGHPAETLKKGGYLLIRQLYHFICNIWQSETLSQEWKDSRTVTIYKRKGDKPSCGNSRGISLLSVAGKVLAKIMDNLPLSHQTPCCI